MEIFVSSAITFNKFKIKYTNLNEYFKFDKKENKAFYFFIDFDYLFKIYLYSLNIEDYRYIDENVTDNFTVGILNLISHYKNYFYKHCDAISYFYIGVNRDLYKINKQIDPNINKMIERLVSMINMIPRINFYYCETKEQKFYVKYNLIKIIKNIKGDKTRSIFIDLCKPYLNDLIYGITKDYNIIFFHHTSETVMYQYENFKYEQMESVPDIYITTVLKLLPVYEALLMSDINKQIDKIIMDFILKNKNKRIDYNLPEIKEKILKQCTKSKVALKTLNKINFDLCNPIYIDMTRTFIYNWKCIIRVNSIYKINEMLDSPDKYRIYIELLMNY